jgi:hypothetical protein
MGVARNTSVDFGVRDAGRRRRRARRQLGVCARHRFVATSGVAGLRWLAVFGPDPPGTDATGRPSMSENREISSPIRRSWTIGHTHM